MHNNTQKFLISLILVPGVYGFRSYTHRASHQHNACWKPFKNLQEDRYPAQYSTHIHLSSDDDNDSLLDNFINDPSATISRRSWLQRYSMASLLPILIPSTPATGAVPSSTITQPSSMVGTKVLQQQTQLLAQNYDTEEMRRISIFEKTSPSVVFIDTFIERRDSLTTNAMDVPLGSGSGFVWDKEGHIVTNYHVVQNSQAAQVTILLSGTDATVAIDKIARMASSSNDTLKLLGGSAITANTGKGRFSSSNNGNSKKNGSNMLRRVQSPWVPPPD
jgi:hypothetical protein